MHRPRDQRETTRHLAPDDIFGCAAPRGPALPLEDAEVVAVERGGLPVGITTVTLLGCLRDQDPERAARLPVPRRPVEPVVAAGFAGETARVSPRGLAIVARRGIVALRGHVVVKD